MFPLIHNWIVMDKLLIILICFIHLLQINIFYLGEIITSQIYESYLCNTISLIRLYS
jgi:hypothetical protein